MKRVNYVIDEHLNEAEKIIKNDHPIIFSDLQKVYTSQNTAYIKDECLVYRQFFFEYFSPCPHRDIFSGNSPSYYEKTIIRITQKAKDGITHGKAFVI